VSYSQYVKRGLAEDPQNDQLNAPATDIDSINTSRIGQFGYTANHRGI